MDAPQSLDTLFKQKLFRIPDYQRGYAWQKGQLKAFWEDLVSLPDTRSHYTGVLTLKARPSSSIASDANEFWLVDDYSYQVHDIVDGQQRLTTFVIFVQAILAHVRALPEHASKPDTTIFLTESLNLSAVEEKYLFEVKPTAHRLRTYKFGYAADNPSYHYLRHRILGEEGGGTVQETFYTLNLSNALCYFREQLKAWHEQHGIIGVQDIYRRLTKRFLFNEYIIKDEFDVFVAFETMNNRGKQLSDLEKLKNRLIYLPTLYTDTEMDPADRRSLRDAVNDTWKEVYHQLGRNRTHPLNDDDFLRAHWAMYFKYSRKTGRDYIYFLLEEQFTPHRVHRKVVRPVELESTEELRTTLDGDEPDSVEPDDSPRLRPSADLQAEEIRDYVVSLKESAVHWFHSFFPEAAEHLSLNEREWLAKLNRVGIGYFRPLVMAALKSVSFEKERVDLYQSIERFIVIAFRVNSARANYGSSEFINAARLIDSGEWTVVDACAKIAERLAYAFHEDGTFNCTDFQSLLAKRFAAGSGYYGWSGLRYVLYEYELSLLEDSRQKKVDWSDLLRSETDMISIEHIFPQTETPAWSTAFAGLDEKARAAYGGSLGNLLLLSRSINSSLQNDSFIQKKSPRFDTAGKKIRNGYSDGSHSEIEVAQSTEWGPAQIRDRGARLLSFIERRWNIRLRDEDRKALLFLPTVAGSPPPTMEAPELATK